jgi:hypothetical protein
LKERIHPVADVKPWNEAHWEQTHPDLTDDTGQARLALSLAQSQDYAKAHELGLTEGDRWEEGKPHHPKSERLMAFIAAHDYADYGDHFCWKVGGDGDNGETLMYEMDAFFELMDKEE